MSLSPIGSMNRNNRKVYISANSVYRKSRTLYFSLLNPFDFCLPPFNYHNTLWKIAAPESRPSGIQSPPAGDDPYKPAVTLNLLQVLQRFPIGSQLEIHGIQACEVTNRATRDPRSSQPRCWICVLIYPCTKIWVQEDLT
jgi:hypothetical protein